MTDIVHRPGQSESEPARWLLVSDLDDTLTGDPAALRDFVDAVKATAALCLAINSSRPVPSIRRTLNAFPEGWRPDAIIGAMGTEVVVGDEQDPAWTRQFGDWDRDRLDQVLRTMGLTPHSPEVQTAYKVSYTVPPAQQQQAADAIRATGLAVQVVISGDDQFDVIPRAAGKAAAIEHLLQRFAVRREAGLIVAGDSANDLAMFDFAHQGILVGNARAELKEAVDPARAYFANAARAGGVLEGLRHWDVPLANQEADPR